ncbi:Mce-associated membrane protein [Amycolatopsis marina]|uniref:Mce-associated membrane protein n=1 Tax=Amycolatopsis marina TaxID=490629 RepID=A0A1I0YKR7_9PSEU|nr:hypothetical protein [Amycolatopsis marina]SFB13396.1 Mce-associated membrane protein [Amycolatopsis marina]
MRVRALAGALPRTVVVAILAGAVACGATAAVLTENAVAENEKRDLRAEIIAAATQNVVAILSYSADTLDADLSEGLAVTTQPFSDILSRTVEEVISPTAADAGIDTSAEVLAAGVVRNDTESAEVILFVDQSTTSAEQPEAELNQITLTVSLVKSDGNWLVSEFAQG